MQATQYTTDTDTTHCTHIVPMETLSMKTLADFKKLARPGARFLRSFPGSEVPSRIVMVAVVRSNALVFPPGNASVEHIRSNPEKHGSWFYFPKARNCRFENGAIVVMDDLGRDSIAFLPLADAEAGEQSGHAL